ncbi:MAG: hypothetical protein AB1426_11645 [Bacillota bacterium]
MKEDQKPLEAFEPTLLPEDQPPEAAAGCRKCKLYRQRSLTNP